MARHGRHRIKVSNILGSVFKRLLSPRHLRELVRRSRRPSKNEAVFDPGRQVQYVRGRELSVFANPQLQLYARILPGDFLHYGYFDDPAVAPEELSLADLERAQLRYSEVVLAQVEGGSGAVLDVGAGMGGMSRMLLERGFEPVALTPDRYQVQHITTKHPQVEVIEGRFHEVGWVPYRGRFTTVLTAESFQYLFFDNAVTTISQLLVPGGRWVLSDYFRRSDQVKGSGHVWQTFLDTVTEHGWKITFEHDMTEHVAPSIAFARMLGERLGLPLLGFVDSSLRRKRPALHYLFEQVLEEVGTSASAALEEIDPRRFAEEKQYMLVVLERAEEAR